MSFLLSAYSLPPDGSNNSAANRQRPSFFEVFAQHNMMPSLRKAVRYMLAVMAERGWHGTHWMLQHHHEVFSVFRGIIENYFLETYDSSFSEYFYGLKRINVHRNRSLQNNDRLSSRSKKIALFLLVGVPYIKGKLDDVYIEMFGSQTPAGFQPDPQPDQRNFSKLKLLFYKIYPYFNALYEGSFFIYCLLYLFEYTLYFTPFLHLQHHALRRLSKQDMIEHEKIREKEKLMGLLGSSSSSLSSLSSSSIFFSIKSFISRALKDMAAASRFLLIGAVFLFKFLEWWYRSEESNSNTSDIGPVPDPPPKPSLQSSLSNNDHNDHNDHHHHRRRRSATVSIPQNKRVCPLCRQTRRNPTLLSCSGFVYCYRCISNHLQQHDYCPVTGIYPAGIPHLRRVYNDNHI